MEILACYDGYTVYESGFFTISRWKTEDTEALPEAMRPSKPGKSKAAFSVKGYRLPFYKGVPFTLSGEWKAGRNGMAAFEAVSAVPAEPSGKAARAAYFSSGLVKGAGKAQAAAIEARFGDDTFRVIREEPERLLEIPGIGPARLEKIKKSYAKTRAVQELFELLGNAEVSTGTAAGICGRLGPDAARMVRENPYVLCTGAGLDFKTADSIAKKFGITPKSPERISAAQDYAFREGRREGHVFLAEDELAHRTLDALNANREGVSREETRSVMDKRLADGTLSRERDGRIYLPEFLEAEKGTAARLAGLACQEPRFDKGRCSRAYHGAADRLGITLSCKQERAVKMSLVERALIITGGPGTGKTTVIKGIVWAHMLYEPGRAVFLLAPTGRAARRASEAAGIRATTVDKALLTLEGDPETRRMFARALVVVDEASMLGSYKTWQLCRYLGDDSRLVLVGDPDQLPSVDAGDVLRQAIASGCIRTVRLDTVYRQEGVSRIVTNAGLVNAGSGELKYGADFEFVEAADDGDCRRKLMEIYLSLAAEDGYGDVALLTPRRRNAAICSDELNREVVKKTGARTGPSMKANGLEFHAGDRVMETVNNDKASNGDVGTVKSITPYREDDRLLYRADILFDGFDEAVPYTREDMGTLVFGYCMTIHKSQGSEYGTAIIPVMESDAGMLKRNLLYTAITRAKRKVVLVGRKEMVARAAATTDTGKRNTMLAEFLVAETKKIRRI